MYRLRTRWFQYRNESPGGRGKRFAAETPGAEGSPAPPDGSTSPDFGDGERDRASSAARPRFWSAAARRLACLALTIFLAAILSAAMVRLAPGFGMDERQLDPRLSEESIHAIQAENSSGGNLMRYFSRYLAGLCRGELGYSVSFGRPVRELISDRLGLTLRSVATGLAWAWTAGAATALGLGLFRLRALHLAADSLVALLLCLPAAMVGLFSAYLGAGPALAIGIVLLPRILRYMRNVAGAAAARPHVLAARARGAGGFGLLARHVWLPAVPELLALAGVSVNMALGAAIPVEALCDSPGVGQLVWHAALARDLPVLVNLTVLIAAITAAANLLTDGAQYAFSREA
jgi:peptide/nickel transport system permease protein